MILSSKQTKNKNKAQPRTLKISRTNDYDKTRASSEKKEDEEEAASSGLKALRWVAIFAAAQLNIGCDGPVRGR